MPRCVIGEGSLATGTTARSSTEQPWQMGMATDIHGPFPECLSDNQAWLPCFPVTTEFRESHCAHGILARAHFQSKAESLLVVKGKDNL